MLVFTMMVLKESSNCSASVCRWLWSVMLMCMTMSQVKSSEALPLLSPFCRHVVFPLGYSCVEYKVTTDDGFVLALHRISTWYVATATVNNKAVRMVTPPPVTTGEAFQGGSPQMVVNMEDTSPDSIADTEPVQEVSSQKELRENTPIVEYNFPNMRKPVKVAPTPVSTRKKPFQEAFKFSRLHRKFLYRILTMSPSLHDYTKSPDRESGLSPPRKKETTSETLYSTQTPSPTEVPEGFGPSSVSLTSGPHMLNFTPGSLDAYPPSYVSLSSVTRPIPLNFMRGLFDASPTSYASPQSIPSSDLISPSSGVDVSPPASSPSIASPPVLSPWGASQVPTPNEEPAVLTAPPSAQPGDFRDGTGPEPDQRPRKGFPVLIMHPEFLNGDSWFTPTHTPGDGLLPLLMVDAGYDVWIGHNRATLWSHEHVSLKTNQSEYWNWTWDDHAQYDLPAMLKLINSETQSTVHYIGVSQSATAGAAAVTRPRVARLVKSITLLGPTIYRGNTNSLILDAWAFIFGTNIDETYYHEGFQNGAFNYSAEFLLDMIYGHGPMGVALDTISGPNCCLGYAVIRFDNGWDGTTSWKNLLHYQQGVRSNTWQHFDYGSVRLNANAYKGRIFPPAYKPGDIPADLPVFVVYGLRDTTAPALGVQFFLSHLRGMPTSLALPLYAHFDLTYSVNRTQDIFHPILNFLSTSDTS